MFWAFSRSKKPCHVLWAEMKMTNIWLASTYFPWRKMRFVSLYIRYKLPISHADLL